MSNETKQTAVEWLSEKVLHREWELLTQEKKRKILQQAKEREKEQIIDAHNIGRNDKHNDFDREGEQYYKQTYGGNK
jgi:hypothetical protein